MAGKSVLKGRGGGGGNPTIRKKSNLCFALFCPFKPYLVKLLHNIHQMQKHHIYPLKVKFFRGKNGGLSVNGGVTPPYANSFRQK